jgi:hypothetical protein
LWDILVCFYDTIALLDFTLFLGFVNAFDVSPDGSVGVGVGRSENDMIAHSTTTSAVVWQTKMPGSIFALRIHGGVVVVPVENSKTVVLDVATGYQLHTLPSAGEYVFGVCVLDGLTSDGILFVAFLTPCHYLSTFNEGSLEGG